MTIDDHIHNTAKPIKPHPDDLAVDRFAAAMKEKLALARTKGRSGWEECDPVHLSAMLYEHVAKGDPRDVANFCMFLWSLGQPITQCDKTPAVAQSWELDKEACKFLADMITADPDQITRVGFHLGYAKDDEGNLVHGFSVYEAEYPEEGVHTLVETNPAPAVAVNEQDRLDAARYRWLRDLKCNSLHISRDENHACNYMTASEWIETCPDLYSDCDPSEIQKMRDTNTIWSLQVYPITPVSFYAWNASTLDAVIDAGIEHEQAEAAKKGGV